MSDLGGMIADETSKQLMKIFAWVAVCGLLFVLVVGYLIWGTA